MDRQNSQTRSAVSAEGRIKFLYSLARRSGLLPYLFLLMLSVPFQTDAAIQDASESDRNRAGRMLLEDGVEGLSIVLADVDTPALTFDQEAQIRLLHETYSRQRVALLEDAGSGNPEIIEGALAEQLLLAAAKFLNPAQRFALGGFLEAEVNADLPQDESELREYLRDLTNAVSGRDGDFEVDGFSGRGGRMPNRNEILEIRINDNAFTSEQSRQGRGRTQIITRGGTGTFNADGTFLFADESLDARDPFAEFRPPYQTRDLDLNLSAPLLRNRLTLTGSLRNEFSEDGDTIRALTPSGPVSDGITHPSLQRNYTLRATTQINDNHALTFSFTYGTGHDNNRGVGGFGLPEQGSDREETDYNFQVQETAVLSPTLNNEVRFRWNREKQATIPLTNAPLIDVREAFSSGGSTDRGTEADNSFEFGELLMYTGGNVSIKAGFDGQYSRESSESFDNFNGTFKFASLHDYCYATGFSGINCQETMRIVENALALGITPTFTSDEREVEITGVPTTYSVNQGEPLLAVNQFEAAGFIQSDFRLTQRFTFGVGLRYEAQSNLGDRNNLDPRVGFAYHLGGTTVLRGGSGIFHDRLPTWILGNILRFDGERQRTLIVRNPSYPDPFQQGDTTVRVPSSIQVKAADLAAPYTWHSEISVEKTLPSGLRLTGAYRFVRGIHLYRARNLNAPMDITSPTPRSCTAKQDATTCVRPLPDSGDIVQLESTGNASDHQFRLAFQQRLSFLNIRGNYTARSSYSDTSGPFREPADNYDFGLERGPEDEAHTIDTSINLRLPWNIDANTQFDWSSGEPYSLETGEDDNQDSNDNDRPPGVSRNSLTGPSFFEMGLELSKSFILIPEAERTALDPAAGGGYFGRRSGVRMTIVAVAENVLNRFNASRISGVQSSPFFGLPTRARDGRKVTMSVRFDF